MRFRPVRLLFRLLSRIPGFAGLLGDGTTKADQAIDKEADRCRKRRKALVDKLRQGTPLLLAATLTSCQTVRELRKEGINPSFTQRVRLHYYDIVIGTDNVKDRIRDWEPLEQGNGDTDNRDTADAGRHVGLPTGDAVGAP